MVKSIYIPSCQKPLLRLKKKTPTTHKIVVKQFNHAAHSDPWETYLLGKIPKNPVIQTYI
jgi:hypothetical protein